ncbi:hypothetical protein EB093_09205, partial [bacterium]|nr:hypothetical protein [bacterium]
DFIAPTDLKKYKETARIEGAYARDALKIKYANDYLQYLKTKADKSTETFATDINEKRQKIIDDLFIKISTLVKVTSTPTVVNRGFMKTIEDVYKPRLTHLQDIFRTVVKSIAKNADLLAVTKKECEARQTEGTFINNALKNMRREIATVLNANRSDVLLGHVPVFNDSCFKYYCNPENGNCFNSLKVPILSDTPPKSEILEQIRGVIGGGPNLKLKVAIFGVLNISQVEANDPPKIPYIDLTDLKNYRAQYEKYLNTFCGDGHCIKNSDSLNPTNIYPKIHELVNGPGYKGTSPYSEIITDRVVNTKLVKNSDEQAKFQRDCIAHVLYMHQTDIGSGYFTQAMRSINSLNKKSESNSEFYKEFIGLLRALDDINGLSILGTIDFIHDMKNNSTTDVSCRLDFYPLSVHSTNPSDRDVTNLRGYKNIVTDEPLYKDPAFIINPPTQSGGRPPHMFQYDAPLYLIKLCRLLAYRHSFHAYDVMPTPAILLKDVLVAFGVASVIMCLVTGAFDMRMFQYVVIDVSMSITLILLGLVVLTEKVA